MKYLLLIALLFLVGCENKVTYYSHNEPSPSDFKKIGEITFEDGNTIQLYEVIIKKHTYIIGQRYHATTLAHDPDCRFCKENK